MKKQLCVLPLYATVLQGEYFEFILDFDYSFYSIRSTCHIPRLVVFPTNLRKIAQIPGVSHPSLI
jgi:hypothetical protein